MPQNPHPRIPKLKIEKVSDDQIMEAKRAIDRAGIGCEPASAAAVAGVKKT